MAVKNYDPKKGTLIVGAFPIGGFADGSFLSIEFDEDQFTKVVGADGEVSRAKSNNYSALVTITLLQTSASNDALSGIALADRLNNDGVVPFLYKDMSGRTVIASGECWVRKLPASEFAKTLSNRVWQIDLAQADIFVGGN